MSEPLPPLRPMSWVANDALEDAAITGPFLSIRVAAPSRWREMPQAQRDRWARMVVESWGVFAAKVMAAEYADLDPPEAKQ